ncbi:MAG: Lipid A core--O-antigen ligase-like protein [Bacteroidetes bacterium]|nr:MAG: Lipid A core--O-antigen ligase-like protein [Bacteroidota bacterium]
MLFEFYWLNLVPAVLLVFLLAVVALDKLLLFCVFLTPISINLADRDVQLGLSLPVEPILAGVLFLWTLRALHEGKVDRRIIRHPVSIAVLFNLVWIGITCITSEMPLVSLKFLVARLWFVIPFYFLGIHMFRELGNTKKFLWLYVVPLAGVICYTLYWHAQFNFDEDSAHWVMSPFYNDHTAYGALLAMFFPVVIAFCWNRAYSNNIRIIAFLLLVLYSAALVFSYTRAAWISLVIVLVLLILMLFRIRFHWLALFGAGISVFLAFSWTDIRLKLEKNRQDTSDDLAKHVESISNITTDASNLERLNRWSSAWRMFSERPFFGWGPGTFSFLYAPYQLSSEKTIISTNAGDMGNAHSEYIGPLSESGVLGMLSFLAVVACIFWTGWRIYFRLPRGELRLFVTAIFLGIITYFIHGSLNNFLDTDKASIPFWGFAAMLVAVDLYMLPKELPEEKTAAPAE